ncbi:hypothetical protein HDU98_003737 [Podochytrium sp. JEL0797]|nr:hypothetical protein HDU98_003737 [Podochytrium sp. JEL0797]
MLFVNTIFPLTLLLISTHLASPTPQSANDAAYQLLQAAQLADPTNPTYQNQINALANTPPTQRDTNPTLTALTNQLSSLQLQIQATTDPTVQTALQNQLMNVQAQIHEAVNSGQASAGAMGGLTPDQLRNAALSAQAQALQVQMAAATDPNQRAVIGEQIAAVVAQFGRGRGVV